MRNAKRGRLLKRKPDFGKFTYEYRFDYESKLIRVRGVNEFTDSTIRYDLIYKENVVYGIEFDRLGEIFFWVRNKWRMGNGRVFNV